MNYSSGKLTKLEYGSYLTAALSYLMLHQQDGVGLGLFHHKLESILPPRATQSHLNSIFTQLENITPGQDTNLGSVLHEMAERIKKRGLTIIISDLMDDMDLIINGLKHFRHQKQEMIVFHIIDREEMEFSFNTRTRFKVWRPVRLSQLSRGKFEMLINHLRKHIRNDTENNVDFVR